MRWMVTLALLGSVACTTPVRLTPYRELTFPPTSEVEVLQREPTRPYIALGEMWVPANDTDGVLKMREKAMEIGADAIVLVGDRTVGAVAIPLDIGGAVAVPFNRTYAVAIRFED